MFRPAVAATKRSRADISGMDMRNERSGFGWRIRPGQDVCDKLPAQAEAVNEETPVALSAQGLTEAWRRIPTDVGAIAT